MVIIKVLIEFHGLHDDLKIMSKRVKPWPLSCTEVLRTRDAHPDLGFIRIRRSGENRSNRPENSPMIRENPDPENSGAFHPDSPGKFPDDLKISARIFRIRMNRISGCPSLTGFYDRILCYRNTIHTGCIKVLERGLF